MFTKWRSLCAQLIFIIINVPIFVYSCKECDVENLSAESNYRSVKLGWDYSAKEPVAFLIKYCEFSIWNTSVKCRERRLKPEDSALNLVLPEINNDEDWPSPIVASDASAASLDRLFRRSDRHYEAFIYDLRTLTNYTFHVQSADALSKSHIKRPIILKGQLTSMPTLNDPPTPEPSTVLVETKGFSARTSRCLSNVSDVIVNTGPLFNGKISVENSTLDECSVFGNRSPTQHVYQLTILHDRCGSKVLNNSRIETMIIVHENKEILTHNSRRFLVVCQFMPEAYTLKASVAMPAMVMHRRRPGSVSHLGHILRQPVRPTPVISHVIPKDLKRWRKQRLDHSPLEDLGYTFERLRSNHARDSRMLGNEKGHSSRDAKEDSNFSNIMTMILIGLGSSSLFVIIIFNFISIPKIWSEPAKRRRQRREMRLARRARYYEGLAHAQKHAKRMHRTSRNNVSTISGSVHTASNGDCKLRTHEIASVCSPHCTLDFVSLGESVA